MCVLVLYVCTYLCVCVHACVRVHMHTQSGKNICKSWTAGLPGSPKVRAKIEQAIIKFCTCPVNVYYYTALVLAEIYKCTFSQIAASNLTRMVWLFRGSGTKKAFMKSSATSRRRRTVLVHEVSQVVTHPVRVSWWWCAMAACYGCVLCTMFGFRKSVFT